MDIFKYVKMLRIFLRESDTKIYFPVYPEGEQQTVSSTLDNVPFRTRYQRLSLSGEYYGLNMHCSDSPLPSLPLHLYFTAPHLFYSPLLLFLSILTLYSPLLSLSPRSFYIPLPLLLYIFSSPLPLLLFPSSLTLPYIRSFPGTVWLKSLTLTLSTTP